ncbi:MAG: hypothetical protein COU29_02930 [Candidatus Magasanikbacteria bacterium CG10_big_fil_rev_8_21_14_0_10_36_32]|uniref:HTH arsR-type domain-containing protein n=1 Tax=Candidatus Magasanikbacteria bacterium CG10_big_fil_rev_8_21_14_0_10_36_32 TaxID=1974646 RepID=A0A2M6W5Z0_9BACT|nr:MAG: hypothetical protein COU29_02930 [Candidatus Magasanikbacteria bacterium CG10_big_fil_rev_8_21_14_0_10_36_32]
MLEHLFGSKTRLKLLQIFFSNTEKTFYLRELSRQAGVQLNAVRRELLNLEKIGIIGRADEKNKDRSKHYQLQTGCLLYQELKELLSKARMLEERELAEEIKKRAGKIKFFLLTGLFTGDLDANSDILLVGKIKPNNVARLIKQFERLMNSEIRYTIMDEKEFKERREVGDKFIYNLFESKHIILVDDFSDK